MTIHPSADPFDRPVDSDPDPDGAIAIVGMACRFAGARSPTQYWQNLRDGVESIVRYDDVQLLAAGVDPALLRSPHYVRAGGPLDDMECFDATLFGLSPRDASIMDPQHRHFLECAWEALEDAGHVPARFAGAIGVFGGSGQNAYLARNLMTNARLVRDVGPFLLRHTGNDKDFLTTRISYLLDLRGPSINVQTACSTSLVAVHMAIQSLLNGECDMAIAGGASIDLPHRHGYRYEAGEILSPDGHCRPFDAAAEGTVFGSGVGLVVLRRLADAVADRDHVYAVIRGSAVNNDGAGKVGYLAPSVDGQASVITEALGIAGIDAATIDYVEAHGTGTPVGDPIEVAALTQAFRRDTDATGYCAIGSVKGNIGHTDTAAGTASLIKVALALHHRAMPPSLHFTAPNPACGFADSPFRVNHALLPWIASGGRPRRAGVSSLGVGGTNAHVVVEEAPPPDRSASPATRPFQLLTWSARTPSALDANTTALGGALAAGPACSLADIAYTLNVGRQPLPRRRCLVARDIADATQALAAADRLFEDEAVADRPVAFLFCGAGSQHVDMAAGLYAAEPVFRTVIDECLGLSATAGHGDLRRWLFPTAADADQAARELTRPSVALPLLFAVQVALARLWMAWGVAPAMMIGHSSGEYAAAHLAGVFDLADALHIVTRRGQLFETLPRGAMLSVALGEAALLPLLGPDLSIAAINATALCTVSGTVAAIDALEQTLHAQGTETQRVRIAVAAHSAMLDPVLDPFRACLAGVTPHAPTLPFISNLTGLRITPEQATDREYWVRHLREPVRFTDGLAQLMADPAQVLLEVGPGRGLASLARQHPARARTQPVLHSMRHPDEPVADMAQLLTTLGRLWASGVAIDWDRYWLDERRCRVSLPTYCFDRQRHWIEPGAAAAAAAIDPDDPIERHADPGAWLHEPVWRRSRPRPAAIATGAALVFEDRLGLAAAIVARLRAAGAPVAIVRIGRRFARTGADTFTIDPADPAHYRTLVAALAAAGQWPEHIYHSWLVTGSGAGGDAGRDVHTAQDHGLFSLLFLIQALAEADSELPTRIAMIANDTQRVSNETGLSPAKAMVAGACRVADTEYATLAIRSIDVAFAPVAKAATARLADLLIAELAAIDDPDGEDAAPIAYRAGERWVQSFDPAPVRHDVPVRGVAPLRQGGVYLVTGGLGGLGLTVARHLADSCGARLALVTRSALPDRDSWSDALSTRAHGDPVRERIRAVLAIEAAGGTVMPIQADVADWRAMQRTVDAVRARFGHIDGIFHAAGVLDDGLMQDKTRASVAAVLAPKIQGTLALYRALRDDPPAFLMLFSSISAVAGLAGQYDYAAANAFLDAFAQAHHDAPGMHVVSVGWSQWQAVGMAARLADGDAGPLPLPPGDGMPVDHPFLQAAYVVAPDVRLVTGRLSAETHWLLDEHRTAGGDALIPGTGILEILHAAAGQVLHGAVELADIAFLAPFAVAAGRARDLCVQLRRDGRDRWKLALFGRDIDSSAAWIEHARGSVAAVIGDVPEPHGPDPIRTRCGEAGSIGQAGDSPHLRFGPRWHTLLAVALGADEALLDLTLPPAFFADLDRLALHPALLDFATAGAQQLIPGFDPAHDFFVPMAYGRVRTLAPLPATIVSHVRYRRDATGSSALAMFDVTITDPAGMVLVEITDFTMIRMRDPALLALAAAPVAPAAPARAGIMIGQDNAIDPRDGLQVIDHVLAGHPRPHILISPQALLPTLARLRAPRARTATAVPSTLSDDAAPRSEIETTIAAIWGELLGIERIGRDDDFFDLGGHSLLAVQFINRLRKRTGKMLPLAAMLDRPTIARLAEIVDPGGASADAAVAADQPARSPAQEPPVAAVVTLRADRDETPLFLIHDGLGETLLYRSLALRLAAGRAVYGIEPARRADGGYVPAGIADMAAAYIARIRTRQAGGPYLLAGLCAGGVIAFEMARQLQDQGESVAFVGIMDAADVEASPHRLYVLRTRLERARAALSDDADARRVSLRSVTAAIPVLLRKATNAAAWEMTSRIERLRRTRTVARMRMPVEGGGESGCHSAADQLTFLHLYEIAHRSHRPAGLFGGGDVVLFRATTGNGAEDDIPFGDKYSDCILGWGKRVTDDVRLVAVPGGHVSILQEPHVAVLAAALQDAIDQALARHAPTDAADDDEAVSGRAARMVVEAVA